MAESRRSLVKDLRKWSRYSRRAIPRIRELLARDAAQEEQIETMENEPRQVVYVRLINPQERMHSQSTQTSTPTLSQSGSQTSPIRRARSRPSKRQRRARREEQALQDGLRTIHLDGLETNNAASTTVSDPLSTNSPEEYSDEI